MLLKRSSALVNERSWVCRIHISEVADGLSLRLEIHVGPMDLRGATRDSRFAMIHSSLLALWLGLCALWPAWLNTSSGGEIKAWPGDFASGIAYTNYRRVEVPWSVHIVRANRSDASLGVLSAHAPGGVGKIGTLSELVRAVKADQGEPLAAVNGDFYARDRSAYAGDPRGLQIVDGDLISAPNGGVAFWVDRSGAFQASNVVSKFEVTWPDGTLTAFGLNQARRGDAVLYTPAMGASTYTQSGVELVLERAGPGPWLPLPVGEKLKARVREVRNTGATPLARDAMVLSLDLALARTRPKVEPGVILELSTATVPDLRGTKTALGGGPVLVSNGRLQKTKASVSASVMSYEFRSMSERHPRSAVGWNATQIFLIQVDGRQRNLSVGMTLDELGEFALKQLGCTHVMNLDGGVSSTLWADGRVRNNPCAGERDIANGLAIVRQPRRESRNQPLPGADNSDRTARAGVEQRQDRP
jgi:exopolysaccharide biosynthesis protein